MKKLKQLARAIDGLNAWIGRQCGWLVLAMVGIGAFNALARFGGKWLGVNLASNAYLELQWYLFSLLFLLASAYTLQRDQHVRVDVLYGRLSLRHKTWIDLVGGLLFLLPFSIACLIFSWPSVRNSWQVWEQSPDPDGLARYPIKTAILICFVLLFLQGISQVIHCVNRLGKSAEVVE
ncbi:MAG: C4-dicarboxylate ABC transporter substrate-binding protein [Myxococcales bacterium]|nr:C4-dicarboxylate ABC transporter substrate-binding protein [Myxococcales bacterium]